MEVGFIALNTSTHLRLREIHRCDCVTTHGNNFGQLITALNCFIMFEGICMKINL